MKIILIELNDINDLKKLININEIYYFIKIVFI